MHDAIEYVLLGLGPGAFEGILAMGIVLIFRVSRVINFALGAAGAVAAYVAYSVAQGRPLWLGIAASLSIAGMLGAATYASLAGIRTRQVALTAAIGTLAVSVLFAQAIRTIWGGTAAVFPSLFGAASLDVGSFSIPQLYVAGVGTGCLLLIVLEVFLHATRPGTMIRAIADNPEAAALFGARVPVLVGAAWGAAGVLAAVAAVFLAQISFQPSFVDPFFLGALIAAVAGGLRSLRAAFAAGLAIEVTKMLFQTYVPGLAAYTQTFLLILLIAVLVLAPSRWLAGAHGREV